MDAFPLVHKALYPLLVITQTIPTVAIAPLLVLWLGYEMAPKVVLIIIVTFFPLPWGCFRRVTSPLIRIRSAFSAPWGPAGSRSSAMWNLPGSMNRFFSSLRISVSYSVVGAVISEWLGGFEGLGVYMTRVKKSFAFDKMFAVIFLITAIGLLLWARVRLIQKKCMPWEENS